MFTVNRLKSDGDQKISRYFNMIKLFYQNKDFTTAKNYVNELLNLKPDSSEAYKLLSQINEAMGEHEQAMQNYKKSLDLKVNFDPNSSFENNYNFTPTKISSPVQNKTNHVNENHSNNVSYDNFEKIFEQKSSIYEKSFDNINKQLAILNDNFNKNFEKAFVSKQEIVEMQKKLAFLSNRQDEIINKLSLSMKDDSKLKHQLTTFSTTLTNLSNDNSKIVEELFNLKEIVTSLRDLKSDLSNYDEESFNEEEYNNVEALQTNPPLNLAQKPLGNLSELFKPNKDTWRCPGCDTPNSNAEPACVCCETKNPTATVKTASKPSLPNGFENLSSGNNSFKFGLTDNASKFNFGTQPTKPSAQAFPPSVVPQFGGNQTNVIATKPSAPVFPPTQAIPPPVLSQFGNQTNVSKPLSNAFDTATNGGVFKFGNSTDKLSFGNSTSTPAFPAFGAPSNSHSTPTISSLNGPKSSEVQLVYTKEPKPEHLKNISALKLPVNFYDYEDKEPCKGCIGCKDEAISFNDLTQPESKATETSEAAKTDLGLFSSIATDLKVTPNKVDSIAADDTDAVNDQNFVSEKSKQLPQNFEVKTGEEDEDVVFNERGKMYHFVSGEWKERGVGNMKILKHRVKNNYRLLMRRDKILNVICNHKIASTLKFGPFQNSNNTLTWYCKDYSEDVNGLDELFALKFKNEELMNQFENSVKECIEKSC